MKNKKLKLGIGRDKKPSSWKFSPDIVKDFDKHIERSIPKYTDIHKLTTRISDFFLTENNCQYLDIGSTTGSLIEKIGLHHNKRKKLNISGIEIEPHFCKFSANRIKKLSLNHNIKFYSQDILSFFKKSTKKYDLITSLFTLQFIKPSKRAEILKLIYNKLEWGGAFIFFEKVRGSDSRFQDLLNFLLNLEKIDQKFEPVEIYGKSMSLVGSMEPFTNRGNLELLNNAGFKDIEVIFRFINFQGYLCIK